MEIRYPFGSYENEGKEIYNENKWNTNAEEWIKFWLNLPTTETVEASLERDPNEYVSLFHDRPQKKKQVAPFEIDLDEKCPTCFTV